MVRFGLVWFSFLFWRIGNEKIHYLVTALGNDVEIIMYTTRPFFG